MIIKIDHVAVLSTDPIKEKEYMESLGYRLVFKEEGIHNPQIKIGLMKNYTDKQSLLLYSRPGSIPLEYINYGIEGKGQGYIYPVFSEKELKKLIIKTKDVNKSADFWNSFGFKLTDKNREKIQMEFKAIISGETYALELVFEEVPERQAMLDDTGFNCIGFISNCAQKEKERIKSLGYRVTKIEEIRVNGKNLKVFFVIGFLGEIVEIISI